jgi:hypothetical protein
LSSEALTRLTVFFTGTVSMSRRYPARGARTLMTAGPVRPLAASLG